MPRLGGGLPKLRTVALTKVRQIGETPGISNLTHMAMRCLRIDEFFTAPLQSSRNNELIYGHRLLPEQPVQVAFRNAMQVCNLPDTE